MNLAPVALTAGEPAGIGPEIAVKAWSELRNEMAFFWIGDPLHLPESAIARRIERPEDAGAVMADALPVLPHQFNGKATPGHPDPANAQGVIDVIARAAALAKEGKACAVCTSPIHKKALIDGAGFAHPGHTEYLAALAGVSRVVMLIASDAMRVVPVTIHIPLADVSVALTPDLLEESVRIVHAGLRRDFGIAAPRLVVAGLNPHAGESGSMGREDMDVIAPIVAKLAAEGMDIDGPRPADTMFHRAARSGCDALIAMYHDQALIPVKTLDFDGAVNVTLGLPFIRTSPDHGTAFDIAGKDIANPSSMIEALRLAMRLAENRRAA